MAESKSMELEEELQMIPAHLIQVLNPTNVCVHLIDSGAVVVAELSHPLSPRSHINGQSVHVLSPAPARIFLGPHDFSQHKFIDCVLEAKIPDTRYTRVKYGMKEKKEA